MFIKNAIKFLIFPIDLLIYTFSISLAQALYQTSKLLLLTTTSMYTETFSEVLYMADNCNLFSWLQHFRINQTRCLAVTLTNFNFT